MSWQSYDPSQAEALQADSPVLWLHCEVTRLVKVVYQGDMTTRIWRAVCERFLGDYREQMRCSGEELMEVIEGLRPYAAAIGEQADLPIAQGGVGSEHEAAR